jgi:hypothetical protein
LTFAVDIGDELGPRRSPSSEKPPVSRRFPKADARIRTADPFITSEVLYQLSYVGEAARKYSPAMRAFSAALNPGDTR